MLGWKLADNLTPNCMQFEAEGWCVQTSESNPANGEKPFSAFLFGVIGNWILIVANSTTVCMCGASSVLWKVLAVSFSWPVCTGIFPPVSKAPWDWIEV